MHYIIFILLSAIYITTLAVIDGVFNRLIFRENRRLPYASEEKQEIYKRKEWGVIGFLLLILLPFILPTVVILVTSSIKYLVVYYMVLSIIQWDVIFGKIVFDDWFGDTPSIALPVIGWTQFPLKYIIVFRVFIFIGLLCLYIFVLK